jgi:2-oxoglutarate dehydrogenase complex dehydrogenase (E1) component-like enzyme
MSLRELRCKIGDLEYVEEMYRAYERDPERVAPEWRAWFNGGSEAAYLDSQPSLVPVADRHNGSGDGRPARMDSGAGGRAGAVAQERLLRIINA